MVMVIEIIGGIIFILLGIWDVITAYKDYKSNYMIIEFILGVILITLGIILGTGNIYNFSDVVLNFLIMEI